MGGGGRGSLPHFKEPLMATRFIDKEFGADSSTAIANDATGTAKVRNLPGAAGLVYDQVDNQMKFNRNGTIVKVTNSANAETLSGAGSQFSLDMSTALAATVGGSGVTWLGAHRAIITGAALTQTGNATNAIHGVYWITGTNAGAFPKAAVLGEFHAGTTTADGAFVAMAGGGATARSMYGVASLDPDVNTTQYGLDLSNNSWTGGRAGAKVGYTTADILMSLDVALIVGGSSAPTNGVTGAGAAGPGSLFFMTGGTIKLYMNTGTKASPTWTAQT